MHDAPSNPASPQGDIPTNVVPPKPPRGSLAVGNKVGDTIGPYRLLELLGEGGFGVVWLAERRHPFFQRVAMKIIKPGMDTRGVLGRFDQERQALAVMDHPNVARVLDGGVTEPEHGNRPYFVMEYVKGEPITEYCDRNRLGIRERLELFIPVCDAVQHAHHKGIVHRDIKPSNVMICVLEGRLTPKVIDFGIAKAVSNTLTHHTIITEHGQLIGTPEYMSPEQAEMGGTDVDTRTDVYSLGVLLYELLTGVLPLDPATLRAAAFDEIRRIVREQEPARPSTRLTTLDAATSAAHAKNRQAEREELAATLRRELEWIPLKAIRKDRTRRYATPAELGADIRRYLEGLPITAAPESRWYLVKKLVARNKGPALAAAAVGGALLLGIIASAAFATLAESRRRDAEKATHQANEARDEAQRLAKVAAERLEEVRSQQERSRRIEEVVNLLPPAQQEIVSQTSEGESKYEMLAERLAAGALDDAPGIEVTLRTALASAFAAAEGGFVAQTEHLERAAEIAGRHYGHTHPTTLAILRSLADAFWNAGEYEQAERWYAQRLARLRESEQAGEGELISAITSLAGSMADQRTPEKVGRANELYQEAIGRCRELWPEDSGVISMTLRAYFNFLRSAERRADRDRLVQDWAEFFDREGPKEPLATEEVLRWFADKCEEDLAFPQAERARLALLRSRESRGIGAAGTSSIRRSLAKVARAQGKWTEAATHAATAFESLLALNPADAELDFEELERAYNDVVGLYEQWEQAEPGKGHAGQAAVWRAKASLFAPFREAARERVSSTTLNNRAWYVVRYVSSAEGATPEALADAFKDAAAAVQKEPLAFRTCVNTYGVALFRAGRYEEALAMLRKSDDGMTAAGDAPELANWAFIAMACNRLGRADESRAARAKVQEILKAHPLGSRDEDTERWEWMNEMDAETWREP